MPKFLIMILSLWVSYPVYADSFIPHPDGSVTAPGGLIWLPLILDEDGTPAGMAYDRAIVCCQGPQQVGYPRSCPFGLESKHLPTEVQFETLLKQLGLGTSFGYDPTSVPDLKDYIIWSASEHAGDPTGAWAFDGFGGLIVADRSASLNVRCVSR